MRHFTPAAALATIAMLASGAALADSAKTAKTADPVVATVNKEQIHLSEVQDSIRQLAQQNPELMQRVSPDVLFDKMRDQAISQKALLIEARKMNLQKDPDVKKAIDETTDRLLAQAVLKTQLKATLSEDAIKAAYDKEYASKPAEEEVHARHILVDSQAKANDIIAQLKAGAKFEDLAKKLGDPKDSSSQNGGDLGWFKRADMIPEFSDVAFKLKVNDYTLTPVHTRYGWHVIQVEGTRMSTPPSYDSVHQEIQQKLIQEGVAREVKKARDAVKVTEFNQDGSPVKAAAVPAAAPAAAPAKK